jgi:hypothetical protein
MIDIGTRNSTIALIFKGLDIVLFILTTCPKKFNVKVEFEIHFP